ncbi:zinc ribbon domain-containing protein [Leptospira ilyithenensis]|uniref:Zinc ribbon domain-containing protein n=1 Tax=Leptospira ilyithenensis TaxID=2484901 RepID=A0A4R9LMR1_9LEPT|nr:zinc ribbon domain-containing protein [Leptospira ilyithenensis]
MATYDYNCKTCGQQFEYVQSMKDDPITKCILCGAETAERMITSTGGIIFKGTGFYVTDYKKDSSKRPAESPGQVQAAPSTETAPKSEAAVSNPTNATETKPASNN